MAKIWGLEDWSGAILLAPLNVESKRADAARWTYTKLCASFLATSSAKCNSAMPMSVGPAPRVTDISALPIDSDKSSTDTFQFSDISIQKVSAQKSSSGRVSTQKSSDSRFWNSPSHSGTVLSWEISIERMRTCSFSSRRSSGTLRSTNSMRLRFTVCTWIFCKFYMSVRDNSNDVMTATASRRSRRAASTVVSAVSRGTNRRSLPR